MPAHEIFINRQVPSALSAVFWSGFAALLIAISGFWIGAIASGREFEVGKQVPAVLELSIPRENLAPPDGAKIDRIVVQPGEVISAGQPVATLDWSQAQELQDRDLARLAILSRALLCLKSGPYHSLGPDRPIAGLYPADGPVRQCSFLDMRILTLEHQNRKRVAELNQQFRLLTRASDLMRRDLTHPDGYHPGASDLSHALDLALARSEIVARLRREMLPLIDQWFDLQDASREQVSSLEIAISGVRRRIEARARAIRDPLLRSASVGIVEASHPGAEGHPGAVAIHGFPQFDLAVAEPLNAPGSDMSDRVLIVFASQWHTGLHDARATVSATVSAPVVGRTGTTQYRSFPQDQMSLASAMSATLRPGADGILREAVQLATLSAPQSFIPAIAASLCSFHRDLMGICAGIGTPGQARKDMP